MAAVQQVGLKAVILGMSEFNRGTSVIRKQMGLTGAATRRAAKDSRQFGASLNQVGSSVRNFGNQVLILGFQLTFLASGAMIAVINSAAQFEKEMTKIITLVGVSQEQVGEWSEQLLALAPALGETPRALAEGLFFITSAGIRDATTAMDVLEISAKAAAIGMGSVKDVANAVTSVMQAYASSGLTAADATDILTATVREGKTQAEELAPSIGRVIPIASQMGVSFQEVGAFIATFTRLGVPAAVAVTSLRSALTAILKPSSKAKTALAEYGLTMDNVRQTIDDEGLAQALIQLSVVLNDDDEAFGEVIGSARGLTGVLAVTGDLTEDYKEILDNLNNSAGITAEGFEVVSQTTAFMADQARASAEVLANSFGQILLPGINSVLEVLREMLLGISEFTKQNPALVKTIGALAGVVTVLGPLLIISGLLISSIGTLITAVGALGTVLLGILNIVPLIVAGFAAIGVGIAGSLILGFKEARKVSDESAEQMAWRAFFWGENIILSFAEGMASAINQVINVLIDLGNAIASWLQAFSPPKLLPNIDKWGRDTMQAWLDGFLQVDFGVFNTLSDKLEGFIRSLNIDETKVVPEIRSMRDALLDVVNIFSELGEISESAIKKVTNSIGKNNAVLKEYVKTFLELENATRAVAAAQKELNEINERFDELLKPINKELKEIDDIRQDELDKLRKQELEAMIKDPRAPQRVKELAQLELKQIALKKESRTLEDARSLELEVANQKLILAQKEEEALTAKLDALNAIISAQTKENDLIKEQIKLLEQLAKKAKESSAEFAGREGGIGLGEAGKEVERALTAAEQRLAEKLGIGLEEGPASLGEKILFAFGRIKEKVLGIFEPTKEELKKLGEAWAPLITFIIEGAFPEDLSTVDPADRKFFTNYAQASLDDIDEDSTVATRFSTVLQRIIAEGIKMAFVGMGGQIKAAFATEMAGTDDGGFLWQFLFGSGAGPVAFDVGGFLADIKTTLEETPLPDIKIFSQESIDNFNEFQDNFNAFFTAEGIKTAIEGAFSEESKNKVIGFFTDLAPSIESATSLVDLLTGEEGGGGGGFNSLSSTVVAVQGIMGLFKTFVEAMTKGELFNLEERVGDVKDSFHNLALKIGNFFQPKLESVRDFIRDEILPRVQEMIDILYGEEGSLGHTITDLIEDVFKPFETTLENAKTGAHNLLKKIEELWNFLTTHKFKMPWQLEEQSPSPWSLAMENASASTDMLINSMDMLMAAGNDVTNGMAAGANMTHAPLRGSGQSTTNNNVNFGGQNISNNMDMAEFVLLVQQTIRNEL